MFVIEIHILAAQDWLVSINRSRTHPWGRKKTFFTPVGIKKVFDGILFGEAYLRLLVTLSRIFFTSSSFADETA